MDAIENAKRLGHLAAISANALLHWCGNPFDPIQQKAEHDAWAEAFARTSTIWGT